MTPEAAAVAIVVEWNDAITGEPREPGRTLAELIARAIRAGAAEARAVALEDAAALLVEVRCRVWTPDECAMAVRGFDHPPECSCHRWVDCRPKGSS